jgi:hypothetical protein
MRGDGRTSALAAAAGGPRCQTTLRLQEVAAEPARLDHHRVRVRCDADADGNAGARQQLSDHTSREATTRAMNST